MLFLVFLFAGCKQKTEAPKQEKQKTEAPEQEKQKTVKTIVTGSTKVTKVKVGNKVMTIEEEDDDEVKTGPTANVPKPGPVTQ
jgi:hypothetical protein